MKVTINGKVTEIRTLWREGNLVKVVNQIILPHKLEFLSLKHHTETAEAIENMVMRGAGAIGVAGGYGMAQAALEGKNLSLPDFIDYFSDAVERLRKTRPTAANLFNAVDRCVEASSSGSVSERVNSIVREADLIEEEDVQASKKIGEYGNELIRNGSSILTHCNAGALAFVDNGTALSPIRRAHNCGKRVFVYVDETRPRCQGARLTAWELENEGIPYSLIVDNAAGYFMRKGEIDMVIVGADRIAANGDVANKIGTYEKAVLAKENNIPFYVAAPEMTFDLKCASGDHIEIEERDDNEIRTMGGLNEKGVYTRVLITMKNAVVKNPSFDVTPQNLVSGFITEKGILKPPYYENISKYFA
jgi:translation initiation factor eIF-2B subunit alpha/methylthioribose-1-phosphate isomerase